MSISPGRSCDTCVKADMPQCSEWHASPKELSHHWTRAKVIEGKNWALLCIKQFGLFPHPRISSKETRFLSIILVGEGWMTFWSIIQALLYSTRPQSFLIPIYIPASPTDVLGVHPTCHLLPVELSSLEGYAAFPKSKFTMVGELATFNGVSPLLLSCWGFPP